MTNAQTEARAIARGLVERLNGEAAAFERGSDETDPGTAALLREAATALAAKEAELAVLRAELNDCASEIHELRAQLAEARKALGMMLKEHDILSGNFGDVMDPKHKRPDRWPTAAEAARRALEAQGGE